MEDEQPRIVMDAIEGDGFQGAKWFAALVSSYGEALEYGNVSERANLVANFQDHVLTALLDSDVIDYGLLAILDRAEFLRMLERQEREATVKLAEREAKLKAGG